MQSSPRLQMTAWIGKNALWLILLLALLIRGIYLYQHWRFHPAFYWPVVDARYHDQWAQEILHQNFLGNGPFFRAPFYPYLLAAIYAIFGHDLLIPRLFQHLIGLGAIGLLFQIGVRLFDRRTALLASLLMATNWMILYFEGELLLDSLFLFLMLLLFWQLLRMPAEAAPGYWFVTGLIGGLAAITRPSVLTLLPIILGWIYYHFRKTLRLRTLGLATGACLLGLVLMIAPVTLRNWLIGQDFVIIATQGGVNFYIGNNPQADGFSANFPGLGVHWDYTDVHFQAERAQLRPLRPAAVSNYYWQQGLAFLKNDPAAFLKLQVCKVGLFLNSFEISNNQDLYFVSRFTPIVKYLPVNFGLIGPLAVLAWLLILLRQIPKTNALRLVLWGTGLYASSVMLFFVTARFRLPVLPIFILLASRAVIWGWEKFQARQLNWLSRGVIGLTLLAILVNRDWTGMQQQRHFGEAYFQWGNIALRQQNYADALVHYQSALVENARQPLVHLNRGLIFFRQGEYAQARTAFKQELHVNPHEARSYNNLSVLDRLQGALEPALENARTAVALKSNYEAGYANLARALQSLGRNGEALSILKLTTGKFPNFQYLKLLLAELYQTQGNDSAAYACYQQLTYSASQVSLAGGINLTPLFELELDTTPAFQEIQALAFYNSGVINLAQGDFKTARQNFLQSVQCARSMAAAWENLGLIHDQQQDYESARKYLTQAITYEPHQPIYHFNLALTLAKTGELPAALASLDMALKLKPDFQLAQQKREILLQLLARVNQSTPTGR